MTCFSRLCVRRMLCWPAFPSVPALGSTGSAAGCPALFVGFPATMAESDFSGSCIIGFGSSPSRCGPRPYVCGWPIPRSPGSRTKSVRTCQGLGPRRVGRGLALSRPSVLPSASMNSVGIQDDSSFRGSMAGLCAPLPTLRRHPRGCQRTARGRCGSLLLHRGGLSPPTPCRSSRRTIGRYFPPITLGGRSIHLFSFAYFFRRYRRFAVGTQITLRPPHRSGRAQLRHPAPTSGVDGKPSRLCRTRSSACDTLSRLCVRRVLCWPAFPLVPALRSTGSAAGCPALFAGFIATMAESDFSDRASSASAPRLPDADHRPVSWADGQSGDLPVPVQGASVHARVFDHAGSAGRSR